MKGSSQSFFPYANTCAISKYIDTSLRGVTQVHLTPCRLPQRASFTQALEICGVTRVVYFKLPLRYEKKKKNRFGPGVYLVGLTGELTATKLAFDLALGAVVLQVVRQVAARQLDGATIGAGYHIEGAGGEVALRETQ